MPSSERTNHCQKNLFGYKRSAQLSGMAGDLDFLKQLGKDF
jgi:hypothetical protein